MDPGMFSHLPIPTFLIVLTVTIAALAFGAGMLIHHFF